MTFDFDIWAVTPLTFAGSFDESVNQVYFPLDFNFCMTKKLQLKISTDTNVKDTFSSKGYLAHS